MKKRLICLLLSLAMLVSLAGCGRRNQTITGDQTSSYNSAVKLQKPSKRQRLILPPKSQRIRRSPTVDEQTQNLTVAETDTGPETKKEATNESQEAAVSNKVYTGGKTSYAKELKAYKKAISKLKGKSFVLTMNADVDLRANVRGRREYAQENINLTANIKKNGSKRMELSGNCSVTASGTMTAFNFYQNKDTAYVEYTSPRYATAQLDQIPTESMLNYQFDITEEDVRSAQTAEDGVVMVVDGSVLNLQEILEDLLRSGFDSVTCDAVELQLWTDKKGRPSELNLFYTVEFTLGDASATADYEETLTFTDYGKAKINKPAELTEKKKEPRQEQPAEVEPQEAPDLYLDEELEPEPEKPEPDLVPMSDSSAMEAYETILDEYRRACAVSIEEYRENAETEYPHVNYDVMEAYHISFHQSPGAVDDEIYDALYELLYACSDIDGNGTPELLVYVGFHEMELCDLYAFDGQQAVKLFQDAPLLGKNDDGDPVGVSIDVNGVITFASGIITKYRLAKDGYSLTEVDEETGSYYLPDWQVLAEDIDGGAVEADGEASVAEAYRDKLSELVGEEACYTLCDITGDGVEELIVSIIDVDGDGNTYHFYTFNGNDVEELGTLDGFEYTPYRDEDGGLILCRLWDGGGQIDRIIYDGVQIVTTRLSECNSGDEDDYDDEDYELEEMRFQEWQSENASYLSEELELWPVTVTTLLERTFGVSPEDDQNPEESLELSEYLSDIETFHQMVGGELSDEVGDHENWYIMDGMQYGNYLTDSQVDEIILNTSGYRLFGVHVTQDFYKARDVLEQDGWSLEDEYEDNLVCVRESEWLQLGAVGGVVTSISYWNEAAME